MFILVSWISDKNSVVLARPGLLLAAEQAQLKPPPVPPHSTTGGTVNHAGCLAEVVDHRTMVN